MRNGRCWPGAALAIGALAFGCGGGNHDLLVGRDGHAPDAGRPPKAAGTGSFGNAAGTKGAPPATAGRGVSAEIRNREGVTLDLVTVGCSGECFEVEAVARGGYPPYSYVWEDGTAGARRTLCPEASSTFSVEATDSGFASEEFTRDPETAVADVTAQVLACPPDAGMPPAMPDAGTMMEPPSQRPTRWEPLCIPNGSFEETSGAPWHYCPRSQPEEPLDIVTPWAPVANPAPLNGESYLRLAPTPTRPVTISVPFCGPVERGVGYYHEVAAMRSADSDGIRLEFYFSNTDCELEGFMYSWDAFTGWVDACSTWPATWDATFLVIRAVATGERGGEVYLDAIMDNPQRCPAPP